MSNKFLHTPMGLSLFYPYVPDESKRLVNEVLNTRWIGQGPMVNKFEDEFSKLFNVKYPVALNSGTSALETAYDLIGLKKGDRVISTPLTCTATNLALLARGVEIIWADILEDTLCIDPSDVYDKFYSINNIKAVVQVHLGGIEAEVDVSRISVPLVSDACQALGIFKGDYTACSFQAIKHVTCGDGGMLVVDDENDYKKAKLMRWFGIDRDKKMKNNWQAYKERRMTFDIEMIGYKRQMTDIAAAMGIGGLMNYNTVMEHNNELFDMYSNMLSNVDGIKVIDGNNNKHWLMTILVERRDDFAKMLFENSIDTNLVQVRNDVYKIFGGKRANLPVMNRIEDKYLSLPIGMHITVDDVEYICNLIKRGW